LFICDSGCGRKSNVRIGRYVAGASPPLPDGPARRPPPSDGSDARRTSGLFVTSGAVTGVRLWTDRSLQKVITQIGVITAGQQGETALSPTSQHSGYPVGNCCERGQLRAES